MNVYELAHFINSFSYYKEKKQKKKIEIDSFDIFLFLLNKLFTLPALAYLLHCIILMYVANYNDKLN